MFTVSVVSDFFIKSKSVPMNGNMNNKCIRMGIASKEINWAIRN